MRFVALVLVLLVWLMQPCHGCLPTERKALLDFRALTADSPFPLNVSLNSWVEGSDCCGWTGVTCEVRNGSYRVTGIDLQYFCIAGSLSPSVSQLQHLTTLNLGSNYFDTAIPQSWGSLSQLVVLNLSDNSRFGTALPPEIGNLHSLEYLGLSYTRAYVPEQVLCNLTRLRRIEFAGITGDSFPTCVANFTLLEYLDLSDMNLTGSIPKSLTSIPRLQEIHLGGNPLLFSGGIPAFFGNCSALTVLSLKASIASPIIPYSLGNLVHLTRLELLFVSATVPLPESLGNLTNLKFLSIMGDDGIYDTPMPASKAVQIMIGVNLLVRTDHESENVSSIPNFPAWIGRLWKLEELQLMGLLLGGEIPEAIWNQSLSKLTNVDLTSNVLKGKIPSALGKLPRLQSLTLQQNMLTGNIPDSLRNLSSLITINLGYNNLTGSVPWWLNQISDLTSIKLQYNSLSGKIPSVGNLTKLTYLHLSNNLLSGRIAGMEFCNSTGSLAFMFLSANALTGGVPESLGRCYVVNISSNRLDGSIPPGVFRYNANSRISSLDMSHNFLTGSIPHSIGNAVTLDYLNLSNNLLNGTIPESIGNCTSLNFLDISNNRLSGNLPKSLADIGCLSWLRLGNNSLSGEIPDIMSSFPSLLTLSLQDNHFTGRIPSSLGNLTAAALVDLSVNHLSGTLPSSMKMMEALSILILSSNRLGGVLPEWITNFPYLQVLDLSNNEFEGHIPNSIDKMGYFKDTTYYGRERYTDDITLFLKGQRMHMDYVYANISVIDFGMNKLNGSIPSALGSLVQLYALRLSGNNFSGPIPASIGKLTSIESLDLSGNRLSGAIPYQLTSLTFLSYLNLSNNCFVGLIPSGTQFSLFPSSVFEGNIGLCGPPLNRSCGVSNSSGPESAGSAPSQIPQQDDSSWIPAFPVSALSIGFLVGFVFATLLLAKL